MKTLLIVKDDVRVNSYFFRVVIDTYGTTYTPNVVIRKIKDIVDRLTPYSANEIARIIFTELNNEYGSNMQFATPVILSDKYVIVTFTNPVTLETNDYTGSLSNYGEFNIVHPDRLDRTAYYEVESEMAEKLGYNPAREQAEVVFKNGSTASYRMTETDFSEFLNARSIGRYYNQYVKVRA